MFPTIRIVAGLSCGQPDPYRWLAHIGESVDLGAQPATRPADAMIAGVGKDLGQGSVIGSVVLETTAATTTDAPFELRSV